MASATTTTSPSIRMVIQRYRQAKLLVDEKEIIVVGKDNPLGLLLLGNNKKKNDDNNSGDDHQTDNIDIASTEESPSSSAAGLLAYISFSNTATEKHVDQAAQTLLNLSVLTLGAWGDGSSPKSILQLAKDSITKSNKKISAAAALLSIVLVPQANVISKVKKNGKSIQYHDQIDKETGLELYKLFVKTVKQYLLQLEKGAEGSSSSSSSAATKTISTPDPSIPPDQLFRPKNYTTAAGMKYTSFDDQGFPLKLQNGEDLTKSASKKLQKLMAAHRKRHEKWIQAGRPPTTTTKTKSTENNDNDSESSSPLVASKEPSLVQVVAGSFGKRQGLELKSDMGPFCHVVEL